MPDPNEIRTRADFARALTELREEAALTVRQIAAKIGAHRAHSTVGDWFSGRGLPSLSSRDLLLQVLSACGVVDPAAVGQWLDAWHRARRRPVRRTADHEPYRGLASYQPEDAEWFFGRQRQCTQLVDRVRALAARGGGIQIVVGASGVGKSSLLRAGLVPAVADEGDLDPITVTTPGTQPLDELLTRLRAIPGDRPAATTAVVVLDQFEELFTDVAPEADRGRFVDELVDLTSNRGLVVVIGLRADFYAQVLRHPQLLSAVQGGQFTVGPMDRNELQAAIVEPARKAHVEVEDELVELLLQELATAATSQYEAGALPLLSHALYATWKHDDGTRLTSAGYRAVGGIRGSVAATATEVFRGLGVANQALARRVFLRLIHVAADTADTRRRAATADLSAEFADTIAGFDEVLDQFVAARLLTVDTDTVQICHEALLHAWPLLRGWLDEDRATLIVGQRLAADADTWRWENRDPAVLYRGTRLAAAQAWAGDHPGEFPPVGRDFLQASQHHARRRMRRTRLLIAALTALSVATCALAVFGLDQRSIATAERQQAVDQRNQAISRLVAGRADRLRTRDVSLAMQLSLAAYKISPTIEARSSLIDAYAAPAATRLTGFANPVQAVAFSPDYELLAAAGVDGTVRLWRIGAGTDLPSPVGPPATPAQPTIFAVAVSPDRRLLATGGSDGRVRLWNISDPTRLEPVGGPLAGPTSTVYSVAFSPDGRKLVAGGVDKKVWRWDVSAAPQITPLASLTGPGGPIQSVAVSPNGRLLAAGSADTTVRLWRLDSPTSGSTPAPVVLAGHTGRVLAVAFSPDSRMLASGSSDDTVRLWNLTDPAKPAARGAAITGSTSWINSVAFSPDGATLAAGSSDKSVIVWSLATGRPVATLPHPTPVTAVAFGADGRSLATASTDAMVRLWSLPGPVLAGPTDSVFNIVFGPGADLLATASKDRSVRLWNVGDPRHPAPLGPPLVSPAGHPAFAGTAALRPDGHLLAIGTRTGEVQLWDIRRPAHPVLASTLAGPTDLVETAAFSPDGRTLATGGDDARVHLWDVSDPGRARLLTTISTADAIVLSLAFHPTWKILALSSTDATAQLWDLTDPTRPRQLGAPLDGFTGYAYSVAFSRDGRTVAVGSADRTIRLWSVADPGHPSPLGTRLTGPTSYVYWVAFSPDGTSLAAASTDGSVWLWDVTDRTTPVVTATLTRPADAVYTVAFSPDGRSLAAGGADSQPRLWNTDVAQVASWICATAGAPVTAAEWHQYVPGAPYDPPC
jgi:WD40 repeat protein